LRLEYKLLKVLVYNGNLDVICNTPAVLNIFTAMKTWGGKEEFLRQKKRPLLIKNEKIGFIKSVKNLTFVGVDGAGHVVPKNQPEKSLLLLESFLNDTLF
jgi:carboxypeptidase C (cathepsin A)